MDKEQALAFLTRDSGRVPCSRYGTSSEDCAPVAYTLAEIAEEANGDEITEETLDFYMGLVVNDHDDVSSLIRDHGTETQRELIADVLLAEDVVSAEAYGTERGKAAGAWVLDGNSPVETARLILQGIEDADPEIMDMQPAPLSGEWAGESIPELSAEYGIDLEDPEIADAFETGYSEGYWAEVESSARAMLDVD